MKLKGGMVNIKSSFTPKSAFIFFLSHSNILYFSHGTYGLIFKATLNDSISDNDNPYESFEPHLGFIPLKTIIFKLVFLNENLTYYEFDMIPQIGTNQNQVFETVTVDSFKNETNIQVDIHEKSYDYGQPICPSVIFSTILTSNSASNDFVTFVRILLSSPSLKSNGWESQTTKRIKEKIYDLATRGRIPQMGIIVMEFAESYSTLHNLLRNKRLTVTDKEDCIHMSLYLLIELFKLGYTHGDHHSNNILIDINYPGYFIGLEGRPLIIDFGRTQLLTNILTPALLLSAKDLYKRGLYTEILIELNKIPTHDGVNLDNPQYENLYGFATGRYDAINKVQSSGFPPDINKIIYNLLRRHKEATKLLEEAGDRASEDRANFQRNPIYPLAHSDPVERRLNIYRDKIGGVIKKTKTKYKNKKKRKKYNSRKKTKRNIIKINNC